MPEQRPSDNQPEGVSIIDGLDPAVWESRPKPTWKCEYCGQFYSERTGAKHAYCQQAEDRRNAEQAGAFDV